MAKRKNTNFPLLIKPVSADCNLHCTYCFYIDHLGFYPETGVHRMRDEVLEKLISSYMLTNQKHHIFTWQGGEPTLMGSDFFKKVIGMQKKYGKKNTVVGNGLQTNGILLNEEMVKLFAQYKFLLGVSLDGPEEIHNLYRTDRSGRGSFERVLKGIDLLIKHDVAFNILTMVTKANANRAGHVYEFFKTSGFFYQQYIPCVEFDSRGNPLPFTMTGPDWGRFLCDIFDQWFPHDIYKVSIRTFDSILNYLLTGSYNVCSMGRNCREYFLVEYNGDVFPCDFYVQKDLKLGNIMKDSWTTLLASKIFKGFGQQKNEWSRDCSSCPSLSLCSGDCLKHRMYGDHDAHNKSWLCEGWRMFFEHTYERFRELALRVKQEKRGR